MLAHAMGVTSDKLIANVEQAVRNASGYFELVEQRASRVPLSRIIGRREFWSLEFYLTDHTFDPRPDSELVVEAALDFITDRDAALRVADFGTGTGCLLLSLLSELRNASGVGIDRKPATVKAAAHNAANLGLTSRATFFAGDWGAAISGKFDLIVTNPPYIATEEICKLDPDVRLYEPRLALDGGGDGLAAYRALAPELASLLAPKGLVVVEVGIEQAAIVTRLIHAAGLEVRATKLDLTGVARCLVCCHA